MIMTVMMMIFYLEISTTNCGTAQQRQEDNDDDNDSTKRHRCNRCMDAIDGRKQWMQPTEATDGRHQWQQLQMDANDGCK
jgi:hypothetical protein